MRTRNYRAEIRELSDNYEAARDQACNDEFVKLYETLLQMNRLITADDLQGFLDAFTFPDEFEWCEVEYESRRDDYFDQKHEEAKDARMGL